MMSFSELAREKMWSRIYLIPVLQAEEDRDLVRRYYADKAREKALLGSETSVYNSDRCVKITLLTSDGDVLDGMAMWLTLVPTADSSGRHTPLYHSMLPNEHVYSFIIKLKAPGEMYIHGSSHTKALEG
jgi:hypothetical protein